MGVRPHAILEHVSGSVHPREQADVEVAKCGENTRLTSKVAREKAQSDSEGGKKTSQRIVRAPKPKDAASQAAFAETPHSLAAWLRKRLQETTQRSAAAHND